MSATDYNYATFEMDDAEMAAFENFPTHLRVGEPAPDHPLVDVRSGESLSLASLWRRDHLLIEFGSLT